jgi:molybdopterin synthase catalytic subunit
MKVLVETRLTLDPLIAAVSDDEHGGIVTFMGTIRRETSLREVVAIEYQAYDELSESELATISDEARRRFDAQVAVVHRIGRVEVGEPSVAVAVSAGHRPAAFSACRYVIDELKVRLPIWKRVVFADGATEWQDGRHARETARSG